MELSQDLARISFVKFCSGSRSVVKRDMAQKTIFTSRRKVKGNMDYMELAPHIDHKVLFSGNGDFRSWVEAVQRRGVRVTVVSSIAILLLWQPTTFAGKLTSSWKLLT
jgi:uncharacterized LabA/DUF88 family protein